MNLSKGPSIQWEDEDAGFDPAAVLRAAQQEAEFAALLKENAPKPVRLMIGEKVRGTVSLIPTTSNDVLIDLGGGKRSGIIEKQELLDEHGQLKFKVGDAIEAFVVAKKGAEILLSYSMSQSLKSAGDLETAHARGIPVRGRVLTLNKGGFEVAVLGKTAFCPLSQIDIRFSETGAEHLGKEYEFLVEKVEERGRNIVVSRAALLRQQAEQRAKELLASLTPETVLDGTVTEIRDFGAFVDIGGVDGLVHISALSHARVAHPKDAVAVGDKVRVKVLKVDKDDKGRPKISLSMKAAAQDPWDRINELVQGGKTYIGKVVNLMPFGAFVEVVPGIEGLLHVSELAWGKRIHHPSEVLKVGDPVTVSVKEIDLGQRRLSLTMKQAEDDPWYQAEGRFPSGHLLKGKVDKLKPFGALVELAPGLSGLLPMAVIKRKFGEAYKPQMLPGKEHDVRVVSLDSTERRILLTLVGVEEEDADQKNYLEYLAAEAQAKKAEAAQELAAAATDSKPKAGSFGALLSAKLGKKK